MRAQELREPQPVERGPLTLTSRSDPRPGPGEVLLRVRACGVCHTDLHIAEGELPPHKQPIIPGHQIVGIIEDMDTQGGAGGVGDRVPRRGGRVGVTWLYNSCGTCPACRRGEENLCPAARFTGYDVDGGYADLMIAHARFVYPIPDRFSDTEAAPLLCAGVIGYRSLRRAQVTPGSTIGLFGFGASAHLAIQVALFWGCRVFVFTRGAAHRALAETLGAAWTGGAEDQAPEPLDSAVLFAPVGALIPPALAALRPGGTLAVNAVFLDRLPTMDYGLLYGERTLRSVANLTPQDARDFLELAATIPIRTEIETMPLEDANAALQRLKRREVRGAAVLTVSGGG